MSRNGSNQRLIIASLVRRHDTGIIEAGIHRQRRNITRCDGSVSSNKMPGVPAVRLLHRYEQMHDIATIVLPVPDLVHEPAKLAVEIQRGRCR